MRKLGTAPRGPKEDDETFVVGIISCVLARMWNRAPGTLTLTVEDLPKFSLSSSIVIRGTVTREPPSDTPLILTIAGGAETVFDTVDTNSGFHASLWRRALGASDTPH